MLFWDHPYSRLINAKAMTNDHDPTIYIISITVSMGIEPTALNNTKATNNDQQCSIHVTNITTCKPSQLSAVSGQLSAVVHFSQGSTLLERLKPPYHTTIYTLFSTTNTTTTTTPTNPITMYQTAVAISRRRARCHNETRSLWQRLAVSRPLFIGNTLHFTRSIPFHTLHPHFPPLSTRFRRASQSSKKEVFA